MNESVNYVSLKYLAFLALVSLGWNAAATESKRIVDVRLEVSYQQIDTSSGDEWAPTWGNDDTLYTGSNDGNNFGGIDGGAIAFGELRGDSPTQLRGVTLNEMKEYQEPQQLGPEDAAWKVLESYQVSGVRYRFTQCTQTASAQGTCIVASEDGGHTWHRVTRNQGPLFPKGRFGAAQFIQYRKDLELHQGSLGQYVYAASYVGVVDGVDSYIVGRVLPEKLAREDHTDWSFMKTDYSWRSGFDHTLEQPNGMGLGPDRANWKTMNAYSVDGVLYAFVTRCRYPWTSEDLNHRLTFQNSSIIMSTDKGRTWRRSAKDNYSAPMFPGARFGAPYFVWYGKDGEAQVDNADRYIYAVSNDGYFEDGDNYVLGRVLKAKLPLLSAADWSFYRAGDGTQDQSWTPELRNASPVLVNTAKSSMTGMTYVPYLHRYVMVVWHYVRLSHESALLDRDLTTVFEFFESPRPWGTWTKIKSFESKEGWYAPIIGQRFQTAVDPSTVKVFLYTAGMNFSRGNVVDYSSQYKFTYMPVILSTKPLGQVADKSVGER